MSEKPPLDRPRSIDSTVQREVPMASAADIPRPAAQIRREEEAGAVQKLKPPLEPGNPLVNIQAVIRQRKALEREGKRVVRHDPNLMDFMKHGQGDEISAELLSATAAMMAALPERRKEKKKRLHQLYLQWARQVSTSVITRVIQTFKLK